MSNNDLKETGEEQPEYIEQEETKGAPSGASLFADRIKRWVNAQNKGLTYAIGAVVILVGGFLCYMQFYKLPKEKEAIAAIYKIQDLFDMDSFRQVAKDAPKLADKFSGTKGGELAAYMAGVASLHTGDFNNAVKYLEDVDFKDDVMKIQATGLLGDAYVENKDLESGLKQYLKAGKNAKVQFASIWWYKKAGRIYEKKNEWKKAQELYEMVKKNGQDQDPTPEMAEVEKLLERAKAKTGEY
jgi:predicted negative regulator of RcsB-dependent stress response